MESTNAFLSVLWADDTGVTAIEYGLLAGLIVIAAIAGISATGDGVLQIYTKWSEAVVAALPG